MAAIHNILVPLDGSPPSLAALEHALVLAEDGDATVDVLYVEDNTATGSLRALTPSTRREREREIETAFARAQARLGARVTQRTVTGEPLRKILEAVSACRHDLVVMGTHGRGGRVHSMLGSVAEGVVRSASCPVLTVRPSEDGYQSFAERRPGRPAPSEQVTHRI